MNVADRLQQTTDVVTATELVRDVFGEDGDFELPDGDTIGVCAGEWRREPDGRWRFWQHPGW